MIDMSKMTDEERDLIDKKCAEIVDRLTPENGWELSFTWGKLYSAAWRMCIWGMNVTDAEIVLSDVLDAMKVEYEKDRKLAKGIRNEVMENERGVGGK